MRCGFDLYGVGTLNDGSVGYEVGVSDTARCQVQNLNGATRSVSVEPGPAVVQVHLENGYVISFNHLVILSVNAVKAAVIIVFVIIIDTA